MSQGTTEKVVKKPARVTLAVSQKNFNRVKYHTHTVRQVLKLEGHCIKTVHGGFVVVMGDREVPLNTIDLYPKSKETVIQATPTEGAKS